MLKVKIFVLFLSLVCLRGTALSQASPVLKVMTFNLRYDNPDDGENAWSVRKSYAAEMVKK